MKKHITLAISLCVGSIAWSPLLNGRHMLQGKITQKQLQEAKSMLLNDALQQQKILQNKLRTLAKKSVADNEAQEILTINKALDNTLFLLDIAGLINNEVTVKKANNLLFAATLQNNMTAAKAALLLGAKINARNNQGQTAAMIAAYNGNIPLLTFLKQQGSSMHIMDDEGRTIKTYYKMHLNR